MIICDYGCGREGRYYFKSVNKWCCSKSQNSCPANSKKRTKTQKGNKKPLPIKIETISMLCSYGCGNVAKYKYKNGKYCCSISRNKCPVLIFKNRRKNKGRKPWNYKVKDCFSKKSIELISEKNSGTNHWNYGNHWSKDVKNKIGVGNQGKIISEEQRQKQSISMSGKNNPMYGKKRFFTKEEIIKQAKGRRLTIKKIKRKYPLFLKIEEMRYTPDKLDEKEMQVHCKNHNCKNSKEKGGWFTPGKWQLSDRIRALESDSGSDGSYFYCCDECKQQCPLYNLHSDPFQKFDNPYTNEEYQVWHEAVLKQDNYECQMCGSKKDLHCHHIIPVKIEPMFVLDPDNGIVLCKECHYKYGHKTGTECSTGNLAKKIVRCPKFYK